MPLHTAEGSRRRLGYGVRVCACSVYKLLFVCALHVACVCIYNYIFHVCTEIYKYGAMSEYNSDLESGRVCASVHHCILLLLSVPLGSPMFMRPIDRPTLLTASRRGGILSLMRSRPLASSKLLILCCGEKPRMAAETHRHTPTQRNMTNASMQADCRGHRM